MKTIDLTPTWAGILPGLIAVLTNNDTLPNGRVNRAALEARMVAVGELGRMARLADAYVLENKA